VSSTTLLKSAIKDAAGPSGDAGDGHSAEAHSTRAVRFLTVSSRFANVGLFAIALGVVAHLMAPILVPVVAAIVLGSIVGPLVELAAKRNIPREATAAAIVALLAGALYVGIVTLSGPVAQWIARAPEVGALVSQKLRVLDRPIAAIREFQDSLSALTGQDAPKVAVNTGVGQVIQNVLTTVTPAVSEFVLFFFSFLFYLIFRKTLQSKVVLFFRVREDRLVALKILNEIDSSLARYFGTFALINLGLGLATSLTMFAIGLPSPYLFGLLAAALNFVPYIGPATVTVVLFLAGLLSFPTIAHALLPPVAFVALATLEGQFLTPSIMGARLTLNPFIVFLSIAFWTWMWGPVGAFLAVPLLIAASVLIEHVFAEEDPTLP
jgi:predicted PurR-regulated permease PerM